MKMKNKLVKKVPLLFMFCIFLSCSEKKLDPTVEDFNSPDILSSSSEISSNSSGFSLVSKTFKGNQKRIEMKVLNEIVGIPKEKVMTFRKIDKEKTIKSLLVAITIEGNPQEITEILEKKGEDDYENFIFTNENNKKEFVGLLEILEYFLIEYKPDNNIRHLKIFINEDMSMPYIDLSIYGDVIPKVVDFLNSITDTDFTK